MEGFKAESGVIQPALSREDFFMRAALKQAEEALKLGEIPVGCVFVNREDVIIASGFNKTNQTRNVIFSNLKLFMTPYIKLYNTGYLTC